MIRISRIPEEAVTQESYADFLTCVEATGATLTALGSTFGDAHTIYGVQVGDVAAKPVIGVRGGIHGNEWEGAYPVREFIRVLLSPPRGDTTDTYMTLWGEEISRSISVNTGQPLNVFQWGGAGAVNPPDAPSADRYFRSLGGPHGPVLAGCMEATRPRPVEERLKYHVNGLLTASVAAASWH